jgi:tetratricopeptide (TPR) repeat protein
LLLNGRGGAGVGRALELSQERSEDGLYHKGKLLACQRNHQGAIDAYRALIRVNPGRGDAHREIGLTLVEMVR